MSGLLEVAVFSEEAARLAADLQVKRIELCCDYSVGGVSPPLSLIQTVRSFYQGHLHVIVRPRAGNFVYTSGELKEMERYMHSCHNWVDGFVFGVMTEDGRIDLPYNKRLLTVAEGKPCTFHRAFDALGDKRGGIQVLIALGFSRLLTSGGEGTALEGLKMLSELQSEFGNSITLMPGGGIRSSHAAELLKTGCREFHSAASGTNAGQIDYTELLNLRKIFE